MLTGIPDESGIHQQCCRIACPYGFVTPANFLSDSLLADKNENPIGADWLDKIFSEEYYIALRCPQCLETRNLRLKSLTQKQYQTAREEERRRKSRQV